VTVRLELGPILRSSARHKSAFSVVVLQLASTFAIIGSLLLVGTLFRQTGRLPTGYDEADLIAVKTREPAAASALGPEQLHAMAAIASIPGVLALSPMWPGLRDETEGVTLFHRLLSDQPPGRAVSAGAAGQAVLPTVRGLVSYTTSDLIAVLGMRFIEGPAITRGSASGIILTRTLRNGLFPGRQAALGQRITADAIDPVEVVGVVEDIMVREPFWHSARSVGFLLAPSPEPNQSSTIVRAAPGKRVAVEAALRERLGPSTPSRLVSIVALGVTPPRMRMVTSGMLRVFLVLGLAVVLVTLVGALAVASFVVSERRRQIGIRRALGATRWDVFRYFLVESSLTTALGTGIGVVLTAGLLLFSRRVFPMLNLDWRVLGASAFVLWLTSTAAALLPARRALRISPATASRGP
jgi:putative ABC transport system permease protein